MDVKWKVTAAAGTADVCLKKDTGSSYPLIMAIPVLISVLWLMFDKDGDGLLMMADFSMFYLLFPQHPPRFYFFPPKSTSSPLPTVSGPSNSAFLPRCKLFSMFLPLRIVSTPKETTPIAKPCRRSSDSEGAR